MPQNIKQIQIAMHQQADETVIFLMGSRRWLNRMSYRRGKRHSVSLINNETSLRFPLSLSFLVFLLSFSHCAFFSRGVCRSIPLHTLTRSLVHPFPSPSCRSVLSYTFLTLTSAPA